MLIKFSYCLPIILFFDVSYKFLLSLLIKLEEVAPNIDFLFISLFYKCYQMNRAVVVLRQVTLILSHPAISILIFCLCACLLDYIFLPVCLCFIFFFICLFICMFLCVCSSLLIVYLSFYILIFYLPLKKKRIRGSSKQFLDLTLPSAISPYFTILFTFSYIVHLSRADWTTVCASSDRHKRL